MVSSSLVCLLAVSSSALAYSGTYPVVAWASSHSPALESLPDRLEPAFHKSLLFEHLAESDGLCEHDAVILVELPGLHASDLRALSPRAHISRTLNSSPSSRQYAYVPDGTDFQALDFLDRARERCHSGIIRHPFGEELVVPNDDMKYTVSMRMPELYLSGKDRKDALDEHDRLLESELSSLTDAFPNHFIILSGSVSLSRRQEDIHAARPVLDITGNGIPQLINANNTLPAGGILKKYQLLTPALISSLLISLFILLPLVLVGVQALSSIQSPIRLDTTKAVSQDKKNQ